MFLCQNYSFENCGHPHSQVLGAPSQAEENCLGKPSFREFEKDAREQISLVPASLHLEFLWRRKAILKTLK